MEGLGLRVPVPGGVCPQVCRNAREVQLRVQPVRHVGGGMEGARVGVHVAEREIQGGGGVLQWQSRQGEWIPVDSPPSGGCQRCAQRGSPDERHWHFRCPHWS